MATGTDLAWLAAAVEVSRHCRPSVAAFSVGAIVLDVTGQEVARGYSREGDDTEHAEQAALRKAAATGAAVAGGTVYSTLEPCGARLSAPVPCAELICRHGLHRVVYALAEPPTFVTPRGAGMLRANGVVVEVVDQLAVAVWAVNAHLLGAPP
jgi:diaminohydroxyphosphoribosylaminopyrimidine deaminase / 5-amino-6-(5-phosphoribosylamino)uracil reductase